MFIDCNADSHTISDYIFIRLKTYYRTGIRLIRIKSSTIAMPLAVLNIIYVAKPRQNPVRNVFA